MASTKLRCFVAMAVGQPQTDQVYKRYIKPVLRDLGIHSIFMGDLEHNDDIVMRIVREIEKCNFAVADLTFARPSVYFEAGYAYRKVPVVYTCRRDHLKPKTDDPSGNLKVHFDVQTRNIVDWSSPRDSTFAAKLRKRIAIVIRPLLLTKKADDQRVSEEKEFGARSLHSRLASAHTIVTPALHRAGWRPILNYARDDFWAAYQNKSGTLNLALLWVQRTFTQRQIYEHVRPIYELMQSRLRPGAWSENEWDHKFGAFKKPTARETKGIKKLRAQIVFCALDRIPRQRFSAGLPSYRASDDPDVYEMSNAQSMQDYFVLPSQRVRLPLDVSVVVCDAIRSERDAREKTSRLNAILGRKGRTR